tara:strand:- start:347 stop:550 length:204 start_codon:yes stop_codon:yes gene_type:complete
MLACCGAEKRKSHDIGYLVLVYQFIDGRLEYQDQFAGWGMTAPKRAATLMFINGQPGDNACLGARYP